jgi:hypothetical protein
LSLRHSHQITKTQSTLSLPRPFGPRALGELFRFPLSTSYLSFPVLSKLRLFHLIYDIIILHRLDLRFLSTAFFPDYQNSVATSTPSALRASGPRRGFYNFSKVHFPAVSSLGPSGLGPLAGFSLFTFLCRSPLHRLIPHPKNFILITLQFTPRTLH